MGKLNILFILFWVVIARLSFLDSVIGDETTSTTTTTKPSTPAVTSTTTSKVTSYSSTTSQTQSTSTTKTDSSNSGKSPATISPSVGQEIVSGLIKTLVPAAVVSGSGGIGGGGGGGSLGVLSKISDPLTDLITSNGNPSPDDVNKILKAVPEMAIMAGVQNLFKGAQVKANEKSPSVGQSGTSMPSNFSEWTPQQIDDLMAGKIPLPSMSALPPEYINTVLSGGALPGLTLEQTTTLKDRYMAQMFNPGSSGSGGLDSMFGSVGSSNDSSANNQWNISGSTIDSNHSMSSNGASNPSSIFSGLASDELKKLDLGKLPPDVIQSFMRGEVPDLTRIPQEFLTDLMSKTPQLFANIVSSELQKKVHNLSMDSINYHRFGARSNDGQLFSKYGKPIPYDVNSLDRKADISMYRQDGDSHQATLITGIVLGVVALLTVLLVGVLCWRHHRNKDSSDQRVDQMITPSATIPNRLASGSDLIVVNEDESTVRAHHPSIDSDRSDPELDRSSSSIPFGGSSHGSFVYRQDPPKIVIQEI